MKKNSKKYVVVRTYSAGVHVGELVSRKGPEVTLSNARRLWFWKGANTLNEVANRGVAAGSKVSEKTGEVILTGAIEVLTATSEARKNLESATWSG